MKKSTFWFKIGSYALLVTAGLLAISIAYFVHPPIVTIGFILLCFVLSLLTGARKDRSPNTAR